MGTFQKSFITAVTASLGVILSAAYMLWLYKRVVFGNLIKDNLKKLIDLSKNEIFILWSLAIPTVFFGFYPEPLFNTIDVSITNLLEMYEFNIKTYLSNKQ